MAEHGDHKMGEMDITAHKSTWAGFTKLMTYSTVILGGLTLILILIFG